jgi:predicted type IV restriction endonuclease
LVKEAVARFGAERVTWTNTSSATPEERKAQGLPDYVSLRDGGIRAIYDQWYGSWATNWNLAALVAKGALTNGG